MKIQTSRQFLARLATRRFCRRSLSIASATHRQVRTLGLALSAATLLVTLPSVLHAQSTITYTNGAGTATFSNNGNFSGGTASTYGILAFGSATSGFTVNNDLVGLNQNELLFNSINPYTLTGNAVTLQDFGSSAGKIENNSGGAGTTGLATINFGIGFTATAGPTRAEINAVTGNIAFGSSGTISITGSQVAGLQLYGTGKTVTFGGVISGTGKYLEINGGNTAIFSAANTYTGDTYIYNGSALQITATGSINSASTIRLGGDLGSGISNTAGSATLSLTNTSGGQTVANVLNAVSGNANTLLLSSLNTSGTNTYSGNIFLDNNMTVQSLNGGTFALTGTTIDLKNQLLTVNSGNALNISGPLQNSTGSGSLTKIGTGTLTLSGANTYTGATTVNAGTLTLTGSLSSSSALAVGGGGTFTYSPAVAASTQTLNGLTLNFGGSTINNSVSGTTLALGPITRSTAGSIVNFSAVGGAIRTTSQGSNGILGTWATTGAGTGLKYAVGSADNVTSTALTGLNGTAATAADLSNVTSATGNYEYSAAPTTVGNLTANTLRYSGAANTTTIGTTNTLTLNGLMNAGSAGPLIISGGASSGGIIIGSNNELVIAANSSATTISSVITNGAAAGSVTYGGATPGVLTLSGANTYTGGTTFAGGTLNVGSAGALGSSGTLTFGGGTLQFSTANLTDYSARFSTAANQAFNLDVPQSQTVTLATALSSSGGSLTKTGAGTLVLSNSNTVTGLLTINVGTINLGTATGGAVTNTFSSIYNQGGGFVATNGTSTANTFLALGTGLFQISSGAATQVVANGSGNNAQIITGNGTTGNNVLITNSGVVLAPNKVSGSNTGINFVFNDLTLTVPNLNSGYFVGGYGIRFAGTPTLPTGISTFVVNGYNTVAGSSNSSNFIFDNALTASGGGTNFGVTKSQAGVLILGGANTYTGATLVNGLSGSGLSLGSGSTSGNFLLASAALAGGTIQNTSSITIGGAASLQLDNTTGIADRILDTRDITFNQNARLILIGNAATNTTETVGNLIFNAGDQVVTVGAQSGFNTTLATAGITRNALSTALVRGTSLGQGPGTNVARITLGTAPSGSNFVGTNTISNAASGDATQGLKIVPWLLGDTTSTGSGSHFVTYDGTLGLRVLTTSEETALTAGYTTPATAPNATSTGTIAITAAAPTVNSLLFNGTSNLSGTGALTVNSGAVADANVSASISGFTSLALGNGEGIFNVTGNALTVSVPIGVSGSGGITKAGAGNLVIGSAANTFTGPTTVNQGTLTFASGINNALNGGAGVLTVNGGTVNLQGTTQGVGALNFANLGNLNNSTGTGVLNLGGDVTYDGSSNATSYGTTVLSSTGATITNAGTSLTLNLNGTRTFNVGDSINAARDLEITANIADGTGGANGVTKAGAGTLSFGQVLIGTTGGQTYSGATTINAGTLLLRGANSAVTTVATTAIGSVVNSDVTVNSGATLQFNLLSGGGDSYNPNSFARAKSVTLNGGSLVDSLAGTGGNTVDAVTTGLTLNSGANVITAYNNGNGLTGSSNRALSLTFGGSFARAAGSTGLFRGDNLGTVTASVGGSNVLFTTAPSGAQVVNNALIGAFAATTTDTKGAALTLEATDIATYTAANGVRTLGGAGFSTAQGANATFTGSTTANYNVTGALVQTATANANSLVLGLSSSINGAQTLNVTSGMILAVQSSNIGGSTAGTLNFGSAEGIIYVDGLTGSGRTLTIGSTITGSNATNGLTYTGGVNGAGTLILNAANTYTGATTVNSGTLLVYGGVAGTSSGTGAGAVVVNGSTSTLLGGTGTIAGAVTINGPAAITGATSGSVGTLTLGGGLTLAGTRGNLATYIVDLSGATADKLIITGGLNLSTAFDQISFNTLVAPTAASYQLATYTGTLTGTFDTVTNLPTGYALQYNLGELDLVAVPEPSTWMGGGLLLVVAGWSQRKRFRARQAA